MDEPVFKDQYDTALEMIKAEGDILERFMFGQEDFANSFPVYPEVWVSYVLHHRDPNEPGLAIDAWRPFAQHHYTAILRCWSTQQETRHIKELAQEALGNAPRPLAEIHLDLYAAMAGWFWSAGAAIDSLKACFEHPPLKRDDGDLIVLNYGPDTERGSLRWIYQRRSQLMHSAVIPVFYSNELPMFDKAVLEAKETQWQPVLTRNIRCVSDEVEQLLALFTRKLNAMWSDMYDALKRVSQPNAVTRLRKPCVRYRVERSSASPDEPYGSPSHYFAT